MASRIKGITIELDANTSSLEGALSNVNKKSKDLQNELKDVERLLKFNPNSTAALAQKQELLTGAVQNTTNKLEQLKRAEAQVQQQFERGDISQEQYRGFQRELAQTEQALQGYQNSLSDMQQEQQKVAEGTRRLTTFFDAAGTSVEDYAGVLNQRLVRAIQNGTATSRDLEYAFQRIGREAIGSEGDINQLRTALNSVDSGNSLQEVRRELQRISDEASEAENSIGDLEVGIENVAGALVAGGGISEAVEEALDYADLNTTIDISFDVDEEAQKTIIETIRTVESYGVDTEASLEGVRRQWALNKNATDENNSAVAKLAGTVTRAYSGVDFTELIQETNEIAATFKISNEEALGLVDTLLKTGYPPDQLDTIAEYGDQMIRAGFEAEKVQAVMQAGVDTKSWNIDNLLDKTLSL
ncbi:hypothetical protein [Niallia sp. RD1]|uniref:hypothetical protein n=1 Tax=Niallia sp. RD1 TaxID=2962858 RepID=UPI0020C1B541|nr:hypothetical protein [Niallia sp. RD1]UTI42100.1 hypothetical protein NKG37_25355 [Niallia sp. RD1]